MSQNVNVILGIMACIGIALIIFGSIVMDLFDWLIIDIYIIIVFAFIAIRFFTLKNNK